MTEVNFEVQHRQDQANASLGDLKPRPCLGRTLSRAAIASKPAWLMARMHIPLGRYCRISPLVFSLVPRFNRWYGVAK